MARTGRPRKPKHIKILEGTHRPDREPPNVPDPKAALLKPPPWLSREVPWGRYALQAWNRMGPVLARVRLTTDMDVESFAAWCDAFGRWRYYRKLVGEMATKGIEIQESDKGWRQQQPEWALMNKGLEDMNKAGASFGWTPADRTRISAQIEKGSPDESGEEFFGATG